LTAARHRRWRATPKPQHREAGGWPPRAIPAVRHVQALQEPGHRRPLWHAV